MSTSATGTGTDLHLTYDSSQYDVDSDEEGSSEQINPLDGSPLNGSPLNQVCNTIDDLDTISLPLVSTVTDESVNADELNLEQQGELRPLNRDFAPPHRKPVKRPRQQICLIIAGIFLAFLVCSAAFAYLWHKFYLLPSTQDTLSPTLPPVPGGRFNASTITKSERIKFDENALLVYDAVNQELLIGDYNNQELYLKSLVLHGNTLHVTAENNITSILPYHQCTSCSQRTRDVYCCSNHCRPDQETYCAGTLQSGSNGTQEFRYTIPYPEFCGSWPFSKSSFLFCTKYSNAVYAIHDFWNKQSMKVELGPSFPRDVALLDIDMPTPDRLFILGQSIDGQYLKIMTLRRHRKKFIFEKELLLTGSDGLSSNNSFCSDFNLTYHAIISYNPDDSSKKNRLRWHLEVFSAETLERKYYAIETTASANGAVKLVCADSNTIAVYLGLRSVNPDDLAIVKYSFAL